MIARRGTQWLENAVQPDGCLAITEGCELSYGRVLEALDSLGTTYTHDKLIASLSFGFWRFLFAPRQFAAFGSTLLEIFPNRPFGTRQKEVFRRLAKINELRNRIAHYEPICFEEHVISTARAANRYNLILDMLPWLGCNPRKMLYGIDAVPKAIHAINRIRLAL